MGDEWEIDSAAIGGWHVGNSPDWRALDTMKKHDVPYDNHARQVRDMIFGIKFELIKNIYSGQHESTVLLKYLETY